MLQLQNITKIYKSGRRGECRALDNVSFDLPERGMVFVLGKSGSGKSTMLNILGGLDSATSGELLIDGNLFSRFTPAEQDNYRNQYVGFIFQDFCLIDGLTVTDNVRLSLDLLGQENDEKVNKLIGEVGLAAECHRYPRELSGGQCQRVAIARALVKSPRVLLADEPTGNLDSKTAKQIISLLKELSKDRLVVVVSHNVSDAENYADRIIELADGKIIRDVERSENARTPLIENNVITLPRDKVLTADELAAINEKITEDGVRIVQAADPFVPTKVGSAHTHKPLGKPDRMRASSYRRLTKQFSKGGYFGAVTTAMILTILALLLCFAQCFTMFDGDALIHDAIENTDHYSFAYQKGYYGDPLKQNLKTDKTITVTDEDIAAFYNAGYEGNIYPLYTTAINLKEKFLSPASFAYGKTSWSAVSYNSIYVTEAHGVLVTNEEFIAGKYGQNGKLTLLAGEISEEANNSGILISDYAADCMLFYQEDLRNKADNPYQAIVNAGLNARTDISGVFETGYKERYADLWAQYEAISQMTDESARRNALEQLITSDLFNNFAEEVDMYLGIGYFLGDNYHQRIIESDKLNIYPYFHNTDIYSGGTLRRAGVNFLYHIDNDLEPGTAILGVGTLNDLLGTNYNSSQTDVLPIELTLVGYENGASDTAEPLYTHTVMIVGYQKYDNQGFGVSTEDYEKLHNYDHYPYAIYFDNAESAIPLYDFASSHGFYTNNAYVKSVNTVTHIVEIFRDVFFYIAMGVALVAFVLIVSFSLRNLRRKMREIGILRALGAKTGQITVCFILPMIALWVFVVALSFALFPLLLNSTNAILVSRMAEYLDAPAISTLSVLSSTPFSLLSVLAVFLPVLLLSLGAPLIFIRRLNPIKIIRSSDS